MKIAITGTPGTGKTTIAKMLARKLKCKPINELEFAHKAKIGSFDTKTNEFVIPLSKLRSALNNFLARARGNVVIEGHLLCEIRLKVDYVIVLRVHPELLESRLEKLRNYKAEKILDNVFCEGIDYCLKHALRKYGKKKLIEVRNEKNLKETMHNIINKLRSKGAKI